MGRFAFLRQADIRGARDHIDGSNPPRRSRPMADLARIENLFFEKSGMDRRRVEGIAADALAKADDGELYLEYVQHEALVFDDKKLKSASFNTAQGFGLRAVA